ncbi:alpha/beta-hydrolase [Neolentinus lepideus HHB14362 ss-1]|uniref:Alpha/beta-hydrolase n=1 Tax=Neolentinus lepideus HHB14362 ss-1 TaxID=1314782 RepID=A0A165SGH8_9AGAM|nr:alpha/beta-hydrolase [Neolentinus lepideus HHB14362 ss-1]
MSFCKDCISGVRHQGTPEGKIETIGGVESYVATPTVDYPKNKVILFLTDVFGYYLDNNKLLADDFAKNGFKVIVPDYLHGDPIAADALDGKTDFDLFAWFSGKYAKDGKGHGPDVTRPILDKVIAALKEQGVTDFGVAGYCFGGRYCFDLAFDNVAKAVMVAHPSLLKTPDDLEKYAATSKAPLLINSCEVDQQFPIEAQAKADEILGGGKFAPGYERAYWDGCVHGFAVRGDISNPKVKTGKEGAFKNTVEFMLKYL